MLQTPGSEEQGRGGWLPVPHPNPGLAVFLPGWASSKGKRHPGHGSLVEEVFPDLLPVAQFGALGQSGHLMDQQCCGGNPWAGGAVGSWHDLLHGDALGWPQNLKHPTGIFRKGGWEECGVYFPSSQAQLGKASAFRASNSVSLCKIRFCKIDNFCRLRESQRNFSVKHVKSTIISLPCRNSSSRFAF